MNSEGSWGECIQSNASIKVSPNRAKAKSLIDTASGRIEFVNKTNLDVSTANYIFEAYYSSVLELLHAFLILQGYKVSNHICVGYYFRDVLKKENIFRIFNDCRYKRNSLIYYGRKMDFETAKTTINRCKQLIKELNEILKRELEKSS